MYSFRVYSMEKCIKKERRLKMKLENEGGMFSGECVDYYALKHIKKARE